MICSCLAEVGNLLESKGSKLHGFRYMTSAVLSGGSAIAYYFGEV